MQEKNFNKFKMYLDKKIMEVSKEIQEKIQSTIKDMTDMDVIAVNVRVAGVKEAPEA